MRYPVVIHKDPDSDYGITVPDLPGCFSAGESIDDALLNASEAIECHVEGLLLDGEPVPSPGTVEEYQANADYAGGVWAMVTADFSKLAGSSKRVNITLPERVLSQIDSYAEKSGETRSGLLMHAALEYVADRSA